MNAVEHGGNLMWTVALGIAVLLQVGETRADESQSEQSAVRVDCPSESADEDCAADKVVVPAAPGALSAAPAAVSAASAAASAAPAVASSPSVFATVSFRNDVGKKLRLIGAEFAMDGEKLPVILTNAEPGKTYVILAGPGRSGPLGG